MANALTKRPQGSAVAATQAYDPFARAGDLDASGHGTYLKFNGKTGEFTYGQAAEELPEGSQLAVDMNQAKWGWICWMDSEVKEERMKRVIDGDPDNEGDLPDYGPYTKYEDGSEDGWSKQRLLVFRDIVSGAEFLFKTSSGSGIRAFGALMKDYGRQYKAHPGEIPIVTVSVSSFIPKNKKIGKVYAPEFKITGWASEDELIAGLNEGQDDETGAYDEDGQGVTDQSVDYDSDATDQAVAGEVIDGEVVDATDEPPFEADGAVVQEQVQQTRQAAPAAAQTRQAAPAAAQTRQAAPAAAQTRQAAPAANRPPPALAPRPAQAGAAQTATPPAASRQRRF